MGVHLTLAMTFPDLSQPESILPGMQLLEKEYPGAFKWMGEVNPVKQALFDNGREPVSAALEEWSPFMEVLRERGIPLAIHADLGNDEEPARYLPLIQEMLRLYPENTIVWMHMGLSRELVDMDALQHTSTMAVLLDRYPNLMLDISWRGIDDLYFSDPSKKRFYVAFLNDYSERVLPGTDFFGIEGQGHRRVPNGAPDHERDPSRSERHRFPEHRVQLNKGTQHRLGGELFPSVGAGLPRAVHMRESIEGLGGPRSWCVDDTGPRVGRSA